MKKLFNYGVSLIFLLLITAPTGAAQSPDKRVDFTISAPFSLRMGDYVLPSGKYILRQAIQNDLNLFALYPEDLTNEPIAMIRTARIDFQARGYPERTKIFVDMDESSPDNHPVVQGWTIPGLDGWEVISVVEKKTGVLAKYSGKDRHKFDRAKLDLSNYNEKDRRSKILFVRKEK